jgi:asparagine synthase (glutamine-hydrolysing)
LRFRSEFNRSFGLDKIFDQPFGNPTFYLMHLISKRSKEHITVALCSAGGDELSAGYPRYHAIQLARRLRFFAPLPFAVVGAKSESGSGLLSRHVS